MWIACGADVNCSSVAFTSVTATPFVTGVSGYFGAGLSAAHVPSWMWDGCGPAPAPVTRTSTRVLPSPSSVNVAVPVIPEPFCAVSCIVRRCGSATQPRVVASYASVVARELVPTLPPTIRIRLSGNSAAPGSQRADAMVPSGDHAFVAESYSSALARDRSESLPPATTTRSPSSNSAACPPRGSVIGAAADQAFVAGSYSSVVRRYVPPPALFPPPTTSTLPLARSVAV